MTYPGMPARLAILSGFREVGHLTQRFGHSGMSRVSSMTIALAYRRIAVDVY